MALTTCRECGNPLSTKADACPRCGGVTPKNAVGCCATSIIALLAVLVYLALSGGLTPR